MQTHEIRKRFLDHFVKAGHTEVPSASVILDDPNLLFVNAGMVQFVPFFLGQRTPPLCDGDEHPEMHPHARYRRSRDHHPAQHVFSDGRQFLVRRLFQARRHRIGLDLVDQLRYRGWLRIRSERLWATVYLDDDEAAQLWAEIAGLPAERIQRRGMADNYWSMGIPGPCGPSSEIYYDRGPEYGPEGGPLASEERYMEIWNLVFMQNERGAGTS